jgi:hypothetical protein
MPRTMIRLWTGANRGLPPTRWSVSLSWPGDGGATGVVAGVLAGVGGAPGGVSPNAAAGSARRQVSAAQRAAERRIVFIARSYAAGRGNPVLDVNRPARLQRTISAPIDAGAAMISDT